MGPSCYDVRTEGDIVLYSKDADEEQGPDSGAKFWSFEKSFEKSFEYFSNIVVLLRKFSKDFSKEQHFAL